MNDTDMVLKKLMNKIFATTAIIQKKFPELYIHLSETPLFLFYNDKDIGIINFEQYLESLTIQLSVFEKLHQTHVYQSL